MRAFDEMSRISPSTSYLTRDSSPVPKADGAQDDSPGISKEVERAIRNMAGLVEKKHKDQTGKTIRHDPARELATKFAQIDELTIEILTRMDFVRRSVTKPVKLGVSEPESLRA